MERSSQRRTRKRHRCFGRRTENYVPKLMNESSYISLSLWLCFCLYLVKGSSSLVRRTHLASFEPRLAPVVAIDREIRYLPSCDLHLLTPQVRSLNFSIHGIFVSFMTYTIVRTPYQICGVGRWRFAPVALGLCGAENDTYYYCDEPPWESLSRTLPLDWTPSRHRNSSIKVLST